MTAGDVFSFSPLVRCKDGRLLRLADRSQFFYDHEGNVRPVLPVLLLLLLPFSQV
jgi:hypothetical protein